MLEIDSREKSIIMKCEEFLSKDELQFLKSKMETAAMLENAFYSIEGYRVEEPHKAFYLSAREILELQSE